MATTNWRRYLGVCWIFLLCSSIGWTQPISKIPDSLAHYLKTAPPDTNYLRAADTYVWWLTNPLSQWERADSLLHRMETVAKRLNDPMGLQRTYWHYGRLNYFKGKHNQSLNYFRQAQGLILQYHMPPGELQRALSGIGQAYFYSNQFEKALLYFLAAIRLTEQYKLTSYVTRAYIGAGEIMDIMGRSREMEQYYRKAYTVAYVDQDKTMVLWAEHRMARIYTDQGKYEQALAHLKKALTYANTYANITWKVSLWVPTSDVYMKLGQPLKALYFLRMGKRYANASYGTRMTINGALGDYYYSRHQYKLAEYYYKKLVRYAVETNWKLAESSAVKALSQLYAQTNQYQDAYVYHVKYKQLEDSLLSNQTVKKIRDLSAKYEIEKRESQIKLLNQQRQNAQFQRNAYLVGAMLVLGLGILLATWLLNRARLRRLQEAQNLRQQIAHDLHDEMGSTLSSILLLSSMSNDLLNQPGPATETPELLQRMVAKIVTDTQQMQVTIDELIWMVKPGNDSLAQIAARIRAYAEPLLVSKGIPFEFVFDPALEGHPVSLEIRRNLYLLGKEAINNLVKYAQATQVTLRFDYQHGQLTVLIDDNGRGFDSAASTARTGLQSMHQRAKAMGGSLAIRSAPDQGTHLQLTVAV